MKTCIYINLDGSIAPLIPHHDASAAIRVSPSVTILVFSSLPFSSLLFSSPLLFSSL
jgi:hypothetical protein